MENLITNCKAREILDSRGRPTVGVELHSGDISAVASVPSGKSTGARAALEKRDKDGGVSEAISNINNIISPAILNKEVDPTEIDKILLDLDGTENKSNLGANAILAVSIATVKLAAKVEGKPLWQYINKLSNLVTQPEMPKLFANVLNGGAHADFSLPFQEYMVIVEGESMEESYKKVEEILERLGEKLKEKYGDVAMGDEGGYAPILGKIEEPFEILSEVAGESAKLAIDAAASQFYKDGQYEILGESYSGSDLLELYKSLVEKFNLASIEDPFDENDFDSFKKITEIAERLNGLRRSAGEGILIVGDDLTVTNPVIIRESTEDKRANAVIIKPNQIGTVSEVFEAVRIAREAGWEVIVSHRSGETMDTFIADLAVGIGAYGIKAGSPLQKERRVKYERLVEIEKEINS